MKIRIFVLAYDEETMRFARQWTAGQPWAKVIHNETTVYLENIMYSSWLQEHLDEWSDCDYVGTLSWRAPQKIPVPDMDALAAHLAIRKPGVVPFLPWHETTVRQGEQHHPLFAKLWIDVASELGISKEQATDPSIPLFLCNYWMATPAWMLRYMEFFKRARHVLDTCEAIQQDLWSDSMHRRVLSDERCMEIFGKPYYPYHCFLCERLPSLFFNLEGAVVWHPFIKFTA